MFKLPFPRYLANTLIQIESSVRGEDGLEKVLLYSGSAIVDEKARVVLNTERAKVELNGTIIIEGDLAEGRDIQGFVTFNGQERTIKTVTRPRNPDGSIFSTEIGFE